jgi:serine/threonine-protein kinase
LGRGGFGRTFKAQDFGFTDTLVVVKQLCPINLGELLTSEQLAECQHLFDREARVLRQLRHPQIPQVFDFFSIAHRQETLFYLVQNYIAGENLQQVVDRHEVFSEQEARDFLRQTLDILNYIHHGAVIRHDIEQPIIHRDIKPSNIIRDRHNEYYLIDFGAVRQVVADITMGSYTCIGTRGYSPPEQMAGNRVSAASDLYALAATCVCLLTGMNPNPRLNQDVGLRQGDNWEWKPYANDVSDRLAQILDKMLEREIGDRFQYATEVMAALNNASPSDLSGINLSSEETQPFNLPATIETPNSPSQPSSESSVSRSSNRKWMTIAIAAIAGIIIALFIHNILLNSVSTPIPFSPSPSSSRLTTTSKFKTFKEVPNVPKGKFKYSGSTTWAPARGAIHKRIQKVYPKFGLEYYIESEKTPASGVAVKMLLEGKINFAQTSRPLSDKAYKQASRRKTSLQQYCVGIDAEMLNAKQNFTF